MAISSIGVGSGLDVEQLLKDLRTAENQPLALIQYQQESVKARITAYGTLKIAMETLNDTAKALGKADAFGALKASTAGDLFTANVSNKAIAGKYTIQVDTLATAHSLAMRGVEDRTAAIGDSGGTLSIKLQGSEEIKTLDISGKDGGAPSLDDIAAAINGDPELGVSATLINDGSDKPHRLVITSKETGEKASVESLSFAATDDNDTAVNDLIAFNAKPTDDTPPNAAGIDEAVATNAVILINGNITITSQSNQVEGAIEGVTLNLTKVGEATNLDVTRDDSVTDKAIKSFVEAYNSLHDTIKNLTAYDVDNQKGSALAGDSLARSLQNQARNALNAITDGGAIGGLWDLGITNHPSSGVLEIDKDKLAAALKNDMGGIAKLFTGENGISSQIAEVAKSFTSSTGLIQSAQDGMDRTTANLQKQFEATSARIDSKMEAYRKQFASLDVMMSQMNGISNYLTQQLSMLGNIGKE